ncbi:MAG: WecB/TagA/CpsF family glycosyltransferase [Proteobacteria bacterium]|nr:WecB/TagA/CpsF family glycosyltransferase [Pseudomonadota bacterium]
MTRCELPDLAVIDGQMINIATNEQAVSTIIDRAEDGRGFRFFTLNLDHLVKRRNDRAFRAAYSDAEFVSADGAPVVILARRQGARLERTTGADLVLPVCQEAARRQVPIALFGSSEDVLGKCRAELQRRFPGIAIVHVEAPPFGFDPTSSEAHAAASRIAASGARVVFVALGAPKQELFADEMARHFPQLGFICIGAALDFIVGAQVRAPAFFQRTGLEWLWRLGSNPRRMAYRYLLCLLVLVSLVFTRTHVKPRELGT